MKIRTSFLNSSTYARRFGFGQPVFEGEGAGAGASGAAGAAPKGDTTVRVVVETPGAAGAGAARGDDGKFVSKEDQLRAEAAERRIEARDAKTAQTAAEAKAKAAEDAIPAKVAEATAPLNTKLSTLEKRVVDAEIKSALVAAGLQDVDLIPLMDRSAVKLNEDGSVSGVEDAVKAFKEKKPTFFKAGAAGAGAGASEARPGAGAASGAGGAPAADGDAKIDVKKMDKAAYKAFKAAELSKLKGARH